MLEEDGVANSQGFVRLQFVDDRSAADHAFRRGRFVPSARLINFRPSRSIIPARTASAFISARLIRRGAWQSSRYLLDLCPSKPRYLGRFLGLLWISGSAIVG